MILSHFRDLSIKGCLELLEALGHINLLLQDHGEDRVGWTVRKRRLIFWGTMAPRYMVVKVILMSKSYATQAAGEELFLGGLDLTVVLLFVET